MERWGKFLSVKFHGNLTSDEEWILKVLPNLVSWKLVYLIFQLRTGIEQTVFRLKTLPQCVLFSVFPTSLWNISLYRCFSVTRFDYNGV